MEDSKMADLVEGFISYKRSQGYSYAGPMVNKCKRLASFLDDHRRLDGAAVEKETAFEWIAKLDDESANTCRGRAYVLREFTKYLIRIGYKNCYLLPEEMVPAKDRSFRPYVFTHDEIERVASAFDRMRPRSSSPFCHIVYPAMYRVIYGCGLRLGEAIYLLEDDVDLENKVLSIRKSKGEANRYVPMSNSLAEYLTAYRTLIGREELMRTRPFFPAPHGGFYRQSSVENCFYVRFKKAAVVNHEGYHPRIHDLRHTFAVHSLQAATQRGMSAQAFLPILAEYLGHRDISSTEYYLHLTLEGQDAVLAKMESHYKDLFREATLND